MTRGSTLPDEIQDGPDLLAPPHVLPELWEALAGERPPDPVRWARLDAHLLTCSYCRTALIFLLSVAQEADRRLGSSDEAARDLFERMAELHRALEALEAAEYERMGAYAEAICARGRDEADQDPRFAALAAHVAKCRDCRACLDGTLDFLREESNLA